MALDNQIKALFPKTHLFLQDIMNILYKIEENRTLKYFLKLNLLKSLQNIKSFILSKLKSFYNEFYNIFDKIYKGFITYMNY